MTDRGRGTLFCSGRQQSSNLCNQSEDLCSTSANEFRWVGGKNNLRAKKAVHQQLLLTLITASCSDALGIIQILMILIYVAVMLVAAHSTGSSAFFHLAERKTHSLSRVCVLA
jgi:hypothetical protein